jgi:hypothetical protein
MSITAMTVIFCVAMFMAALALLFIALNNDLFRLKHYGRNAGPIALTDKPFKFGVMHYRNDFKWRQLPEPSQEYFVCMRLPFYGMRYQINRDEECWSQDCLYIGMNRGFLMFSRELPPVAQEMK